MGDIIGYARVSTDGQSVHDQIVQLKAADATRVLSEKLSGARFDRPQLRKAIAALGRGDVLIITRLDRLARSTRDLLNILHEVGECGAAFKSLADAWADTTTPHGKLMVTIPNVWSGRALQEVFVDLAMSGLASMYPASAWSALCSGPSWITSHLHPTQH